MKPSEIREMADDELKNLEGDLAQKLWKARLDNQLRTLDSTAEIKAIRRDIARVKTIITERKRAEQS